MYLSRIANCICQKLLADQIADREERALPWKGGRCLKVVGGTMAIKPERLSVTVQKASKASYMSECGQALNREVERKSHCYIVVFDFKA